MICIPATEQKYSDMDMYDKYDELGVAFEVRNMNIIHSCF